jgi:dihydroxy-acid dehydratase
MEDIDRLSKETPVLCKVAPNSDYHVEDVNQAGGIISILGELARGGLLDTRVKRADGLNLGEAIEKYDITQVDDNDPDVQIYRAAPGLRRNLVMGSQKNLHRELDKDRENGCIRSVENAYSQDGGLAILYGNIATNGSIVKTAGVDPSVYEFKGSARVFNSQDSACDAILNDEIIAGDVIVINYEGPKGGPGMQEMLYPTSYIKAKGLGAKCALITDGRFSGGTSGLSIGHVSPEAAASGEIALVRDGDKIEISITKRSVNLDVSEEELSMRRQQEEEKGKNAFRVTGRDRKVSKALKAYASMVTSADQGAIRIIE